MPDGTKAQSSMDPIELWRQWNETTSQMWLSAIDKSKGATTDPSNFYRAWAKNVQLSQEQMRQNPLVIGSREMWKMWFGATMEIWKQAASTDRTGLTTGWLKLMEETQARMLSGETLPSDPFTLFRQWYDATSEQWSKSVEQVIGSEQFLEATGPFMESYTSLLRAFRRASEEYFQQLQLPTLSDIARVAGLVINLEEKVDKIEDAVEDLTERNKQTATAQAVMQLERRIEGLATNQTVNALQERLSQTATTQAVTQLERRIEGLATHQAVDEIQERLNQTATTQAVTQLEGRIDSLATSQAVNTLQERLSQTAQAVTQLEGRIDGLATSQTVNTLQNRLDEVEHKLDLVLTALEKIEAAQSRLAQAQAHSREAASRKGQKKAPEPQEVAQEA